MPVHVVAPGGPGFDCGPDDPPGGTAAAVPPGEPALRCAFVNNMPDSAFAASERQFLGLLQAGSGATAIEVRRYSFAAVGRGPKVTVHLGDQYFPIDQLWDNEPDLVMVTGSEPVADSLEAEPYWPETAQLLALAEEHPTSIMLSCLTAHFALHALDGTERTRLAAKCAGVFAHDVDRTSPLTSGLGSSVLVPHSRLNDIGLSAVEPAGWDVVLSAPGVGWAAIAGRRRGCDLLLLQGHPEYDAASLLREYRRDAKRYLTGERDVQPVLPADCVGPYDRPAIGLFHQRVCSGRRDPAVIGDFDFEAAGRRASWPWRPAAEELYRNWVRQVCIRNGFGDRATSRRGQLITNETR